MLGVEYLIRLLDHFSPEAERIARSARDAMKGAQGMGKAITDAEKAVAGAGKAVGSAAGGMETMARNAAQAQQGLRGMASAADAATLSQKELARIEEQRARAAERLARRDAGFAARSIVPGPDGGWIAPSVAAAARATVSGFGLASSAYSGKSSPTRRQCARGRCQVRQSRRAAPRG